MSHKGAVAAFFAAVIVAASVSCTTDSVAPPLVSDPSRGGQLSRMRAELLSTIEGMEFS
jgi:hypothetical protein